MKWTEQLGLREDQRTDPIAWSFMIPDPERLPVLEVADFDTIFGTKPGARGRMLRTYGGENSRAPHWIATRGGTDVHTDPAYARYSVQIAVYNFGCTLRGLDPNSIKVWPTGSVYCLDTHSPHQVEIVPRSPIVCQKLQASRDFWDYPEPDDPLVQELIDFALSHHPLDQLERIRPG